MLTLSSKLKILAKILFFVSIILPGSISANDKISDFDPPSVKVSEITKFISNKTVVFTSFNITKKGNKAILAWSTSYELGNKGFSIERSIDKEEWTDIALVEGQSKSCDYIDYQYIDYQPENGTNFYRVKQMDYTGKNEVTKIKSLEFDIKINNENIPIYAFHKN